MIKNGDYVTKKCSCDNPKWTIEHKNTIQSGKNIGKIQYIVSCQNCRAQWKTMSTKGIEELI